MQKDNVTIFYVLKEKTVPSRILYMAKAPFKCRSIRKRLQTTAETCPENMLGWRKKKRNTSKALVCGKTRTLKSLRNKKDCQT